jgi:hypothetical protein
MCPDVRPASHTKPGLWAGTTCCTPCFLALQAWLQLVRVRDDSERAPAAAASCFCQVKPNLRQTCKSQLRADRMSPLLLGMFVGTARAGTIRPDDGSRHVIGTERDPFSGLNLAGVRQLGVRCTHVGGKPLHQDRSQHGVLEPREGLGNQGSDVARDGVSSAGEHLLFSESETVVARGGGGATRRPPRYDRS